MTAREIDVILKRLDQQDADNVLWRKEQREDLHELKRDVKEVKNEVKYTNGRVTQLEKVNERESGERNATDGASEKRRLKWGLIAAVIGATAGVAFAIIGAIQSHLL